jgi:DNA-binding MarR family transcriptional regulator
MNDNYFEMMKAAFKVKTEVSQKIDILLDHLGVTDLNPLQFMILKDIGSQQLTVGQIGRLDGFCGTNPNYNLNSMFKRGYISARACTSDKRKVYYKLSNKAKDLCEKIDQLMETQPVVQQELPERFVVKELKQLLAA